MGTSFTGVESGYSPEAIPQVNSAQASIFSRVTAAGSYSASHGMQKLHIAEMRPQKKGGGGLRVKVSSLPGPGFPILKYIRPTERKGNQTNGRPGSQR